MKKILGIVVLIFSFSVGQLIFAQGCTSTCRCGNYEIWDYGCTYTNQDCYDIDHLSCYPAGNTCCYYEYGYCPGHQCPGHFFYFRKCYLDSCNH